MSISSFIKENCVQGDWLEVIGPHQSVDHLATSLGTISYEILTSLSRRAEHNILT